MKYYIIAAEASGDLHGSNLIAGLRANDPQAEFRFWGGDLMRDAAAEAGYLVKHYRENSIMGFTAVIKNIGSIFNLMKFCKRDIVEFAPDVVILIDYPGFNVRVAKFTKKIGIKTYYYIAPKVWAWREYRVKKLRRNVDRMFVIFPFEVDYFASQHIDAFYTGNPLMDSISKRAAMLIPRDRYMKNNDFGDRPIITLVAGSRSHEISYNLPTMVEVSRRMPEYQFVVTGVDWIDSELYARIIAGSDVRVVYGQTYETMKYADGALVTSGTATLETALLGTHQVVCFRNAPLTIWLVRHMIKVRFVSLVNLILDYGAVRELLQGDYTVESAEHELRAVLPGGAGYDKMCDDYRNLRDVIGAPGASDRIAVEMIKSLRA